MDCLVYLKFNCINQNRIGVSGSIVVSGDKRMVKDVSKVERIHTDADGITSLSKFDDGFYYADINTMLHLY